jgi:hypothetical protein
MTGSDCGCESVRSTKEDEEEERVADVERLGDTGAGVVIALEPILDEDDDTAMGVLRPFVTREEALLVLLLAEVAAGSGGSSTTDVIRWTE